MTAAVKAQTTRPQKIANHSERISLRRTDLDVVEENKGITGMRIGPGPKMRQLPFGEGNSDSALKLNKIRRNVVKMGLKIQV